MARIDVHALALEKAGRVLGLERASSLLQHFLGRMRKPKLATTDDLHAFGEALGDLGGIEQAVGALLIVQAVLIDIDVSPEFSDEPEPGRAIKPP